jgi:hypothetical protein
MAKRGNKKRGEERRDQEIHLRVTKSEFDELEVASYATEESKSDIIRKALKMYLSGIKGSY